MGLKNLVSVSRTYEANSFTARHQYVKKRAQGCEPQDFDSVMTNIYKAPEGWMAVDHTFVEHNGRLHLFYITGRPENFGKAEAYKPGSASEIGNGHAVGTGLNNLAFEGIVLDDPQGDWDCLTTGGAPSISTYNRQFICVYVGRGSLGQVMGVARSEDLYTWKPVDNNPVFTPPVWTKNPGACKDPHIFVWEGKYFIYYTALTKDGLSCVALKTTEDWEHFEDMGPVFRDACHMRGTGGIESTCVFEREGIFHLFYTAGQGLWHSVSDNPYKWDETKGRYLVGPFVACEVFQWNGEWWLTSTRKEESRRRDRIKGISNHSSVEDEQRNLQGLFLSHIAWDEDFPNLEKPDRLLAQYYSL